MLLRYERGDGGEDFLSLRTSLALHATPLLREGEENIAQAWSAELEQKPDDSADETGDAQDNEGTVLTQEETPDEIAVTENGSPARTLKASDPSGYTVFGNVYINNGSDAALDASMLSAGAVTLTPQSVTAESASEHSIRPVRFFCIVIHLLGQSYVRTCADMT